MTIKGWSLKRPPRVVDSTGMDFREDQEAVTLPSRAERLQELAKQIAEGTYRIPAEWVAEAILTWRGRSGRRN